MVSEAQEDRITAVTNIEPDERWKVQELLPHGLFPPEKFELLSTIIDLV